MERIIFCVFSAKDEEVYNDLVPHFFPPTEEDLEAQREQDTEDESDSELARESEQSTVWHATFGSVNGNDLPALHTQLEQLT